MTEENARLIKRIGKIDFVIRPARQTDEPRLRPEARIEAITAWLLSEWRREQMEGHK